MIAVFNTTKYCKESEKQGSIPGFLKISKDVMSIVWASMLESLLVALVTMFDGIQVASIGNEANAAVTICRQPYFILIAIMNSLSVTLSTIISRRRGQGDIDSANKTLHLGIVLSFVVSIFLSILFIVLAKPLCLMMRAEEDTLPLAVTYISILSGGFIFNGLRLTINACQKGMGKTKISMISNVFANLVNVFLNYALITGNLGFPELGIAGAAIATVIGNFVAFAISFASLFFEKDYIKFSFKRIFKFNKESFIPIGKLIPSVLIEQMLMRIGFIIFAIIVNNLGTDDTYVQGICNDINSLLFTLADGFAIGTAAIVGRRLGEGRKDLAIVYAKVAMILSVSCGIIMAIAMLCLRRQLIGLYKPDNEEKFIKACNVLILAAIACVPQNIQWVNLAILRTSGDTKFTASVSLISVAILRPIITYLFIYVLFGGLGVYGAWVGQIIDQLIRMTLNLSRFHSRKWINIKV